MAKPNENWLTPTLCSFDEKVRVERGPQVIQLPCDDANLADSVTPPDYKIGGRDAEGRLIRPDEAIAVIEANGGDTSPLKAAASRDNRLGRTPVQKGEMMSVVDRKGKHKPFLWKIYRWTETDEINEATGENVWRFIKVDEIQGRDDALARGRAIVEEMA